MEMSTIEPKIFAGLSWRQIKAAALLVPLYLVPFGLAYWQLAPRGVPIPVLLLVPMVWSFPVCAYGWYRPSGLMPENYLGFVYRFYMSSRTLLRDGQPAHVQLSAKTQMNEH
ncbi:PrgI family protein [Alloscardovia macacae]